MSPPPDIAILVPAYNEAATIAQVIEQFHAELPHAQIWVINNNSKDETHAIADSTLKRLGARGGVLFEQRQGKAFAVRHGVHMVEADMYVLVDGDTTYPASSVHALIAPVAENRADMAVGDRISGGHYARENKRALHGMGNGLVMRLINTLFGAKLHDVMSGYRAFTRTFIKTYPILIDGFEIETDITLHALDKRQRIIEIPIDYKDRPDGSMSKLNTMTDGLRVLTTIFNIFRIYKPMAFFGIPALVLALAGIALGAIPVIEFMQTRFITHVPLAILATGLEIFSLVLVAVALILDTVAHNARVNFELQLLRFNYRRCERAELPPGGGGTG